MYATGIALSFVAMLCWGFGDFLIQKSARKIGDWETLFIITFVGTIILLPFVGGSFGQLFSSGDNLTWSILVGAALVMFVAALFDFEALRIGKITVVEPIWSTEVVASALLAFIVIGEELGLAQIILILALISGLVVVSMKERDHLKLKHFFVEKGVVLAFIAAMTMGVANFLIGWGSRIADPILSNFFVNVIITVLTGSYLLWHKKMGKLIRDVKESPNLLTTMAISDNVAWIAFAYAMSLAPIGIAVALSESYIIVAVLLGFMVSKERLQRHQKLGIVWAICAAVILSVITA
ncbi:MAG: DMT family transporter [Candidatus Paceibacterota bacterium]|jgi:drug/metabolite transporter (DMT)-like permease